MSSPLEDEDLKTDQDQQQQENSSNSDLSDTVNSEDSSNSNMSENDPSTFDVVMKAIDPEKVEDEEDGENEDDSDAKAEEDDSGKEPDKGDKKDDAEDEFEDFTPEERANLKKATAERFDKLKGLYHKEKEQVSALTSQLEQVSVDAGHYQQFAGFLEQNRITGDEANELFEIGALMKNDPVKALQLIQPHYQQLLEVTGNIIPQDLQQQVKEGYITREHALELSRSRATGQTSKAISQQQQAHNQQVQARQQQQEQINAVQTGITEWERSWSSSDPDYAAKKDRVLERVELMLARASKTGNLPKTVDEAIKLADEAKNYVEKDLRSFMPKRKINTVDGGGSVPNAMPQPKDTRDVIRRTLNQ